MSKSLLLFGSSGHLAKTKIIPATKSLKMTVIGTSRKNTHETLPWMCIHSDTYPLCDLTYMSLPVDVMLEHIAKVPLDTTLCLEKPHGHDKTSFENVLLKSVSDHKTLFVDHFLHKYIPS